MIRLCIVLIAIFHTALLASQLPPASWDDKIEVFVRDVSASRIEADIRQQAAFGTRHTLSDTLSQTRGIGAARRWIYEQFKTITKNCSNCLEISYQYNFVKAGDYARIPEDTWVVNVIATLQGTEFPNRYIIMAGDIDSRISDPLDGVNDSPGANDNASGMAGVM